jgi:hypothetical protein
VRSTTVEASCGAAIPEQVSFILQTPAPAGSLRDPHRMNVQTFHERKEPRVIPTKQRTVKSNLATLSQACSHPLQCCEIGLYLSGASAGLCGRDTNVRVRWQMI